MCWQLGKTSNYFWQSTKQYNMENLQSVIENAMLQANIDAWCTSHGINPEIVTYKDGILMIPLNFSLKAK